METKVKAELLSKEDFTRIVTRLAHEILEKNRGVNNLVIVGIRTRGAYLATRISETIEKIEKVKIPTDRKSVV